MSEKQTPNYQIEKTSYTYRPNADGSMSQVGQPKTSVVKGVNNFKELKSSLAPDKLKDNQSVAYEDTTFTTRKDKFGRVQSINRNPSRIHHMTEKKSNGDIVVTYFKGKSK